MGREGGVRRRGVGDLYTHGSLTPITLSVTFSTDCEGKFQELCPDYVTIRRSGHLC